MLKWSYTCIVRARANDIILMITDFPCDKEVVHLFGVRGRGGVIDTDIASLKISV